MFRRRAVLAGLLIALLCVAVTPVVASAWVVRVPVNGVPGGIALRDGRVVWAYADGGKTYVRAIGASGIDRPLFFSGLARNPGPIATSGSLVAVSTTDHALVWPGTGEAFLAGSNRQSVAHEIALSPSATLFSGGAQADGTIRGIQEQDLERGPTVVGFYRNAGPPLSVAGRWLVTGLDLRETIPPDQQMQLTAVGVWDRTTGELVRTIRFPGKAQAVRDLAVNDDGQVVIHRDTQLYRVAPTSSAPRRMPFGRGYFSLSPAKGRLAILRWPLPYEPFGTSSHLGVKSFRDLSRPPVWKRVKTYELGDLVSIAFDGERLARFAPCKRYVCAVVDRPRTTSKPR